MSYEFPKISDYGDLHDLTAASVLRVTPDSEAPGEAPPLDDNTGACQPNFPDCDNF